MDRLANPLEWKVGLVGYGEVGRILAEDLRKNGVKVGTYDIKLGTGDEAPLAAHAQQHGVRLFISHAALARDSDLLISAVTAEQTLAAAESCAAYQAHVLYLDLNSASPGVKRRAGELIEAAGGRYIEAAVMTSVPPHRLGVPMLLGGPHGEQLVEPLRRLGFAPRAVAGDTGQVSATKMCRSVMIKGLEAMLIESLTTARFYGVENEVLGSLEETFPGIDWERQAGYLFSRVIAHGRRRAEEMREAAQTVREAGLSPWSAAGTAQRQTWMAMLSEAGLFGAANDAFCGGDWRFAADRILAHLALQENARIPSQG
jgi:3-hydroxyisobutyrate dehydrogenase-like beta-hydroxyacid dehydrogenase